MDADDTSGLEPPAAAEVVNPLEAEQAVLAHARAGSQRIVRRVREAAGDTVSDFGLPDGTGEAPPVV